MFAQLSSTMTLREFENGYWYLTDLRDFAIQIGIPRSQKTVWAKARRKRERRKDQFVPAING
jgi:hypothetical protein